MVPSEGIAHGHDPFAHAQLVRIAEGQHGEIIDIDFDDGQVGTGVQPDDLRFHLALVDQLDGQLFRVFHHVIVRQDVAVLRHDDPGSLAHERPGPVVARRSAAEEILEGAPEPLRLRLPGYPLAFDQHHRRLHPLGDGGEGLAEVLQRPLVRGNHRRNRPVFFRFADGGVPVGNEEAAEHHARDEQRRAGEAADSPFLRHA